MNGLEDGALFLGLLAYLFRLARQQPSQRALAGVLMQGARLGFLLTHEPYCYPPLILAASLILAANIDRSPNLDGAIQKVLV